MRIYAFGLFRLDEARQRLDRDGSRVDLTPTMYAALLLLVRNAGRLVTKDELFEAVWHGRIVEESNLRQTVFALRKALGDDRAMIVTLAGRGYEFAAPVTVEDRPAPLATPASPTLAAGRGDRRRRIPRRFAAGAALALGAAASASAWMWFRSTGTPLGPQHLVMLADFDNRTREAIFDGSLQDLLRADLGQSPFVNILPDGQARSMLALMEKPATTKLTGAVAAEVCTRRNADAVVQGAIAPMGSSYLVSLAASDCTNGRQLAAADRQVARREDVVPALDGLIGGIRRQLGESLASVTRYNVPLIDERTGSLDAIKALSEGYWLVQHGKLADAVPVLQRAIALDHDLAAAHGTLAIVYLNMMDSVHGNEELTKAYALRDRVNERNRYSLMAQYEEFVLGDKVAAARDTRVLTNLYPQSAVAWSNLANLENDLGRFAQAVADGKRALALNPLLENAYTVTARAERCNGDLAAARATLMTSVARGLAGEGEHRESLVLAIAANDARSLATEVDWAEKHASTIIATTRGEYAMSQGRMAEAGALFAAARSASPPGGYDGHIGRAALLSYLDLDGQALAAEAPLPADENDDDLLDVASIAGPPAKGEALLARLQAARPRDTLLTQIYLPQAHARLALRRGDPSGALRALAPALGYQARGFQTLTIAGSAYLAEGDGRRAATAYRTLIAHAHWQPESPLIPLARLGLARALRLQHDLAGARAQYAAFLAAFANGDRALPPVRAAEIEMRRVDDARRPTQT